MDSPPVPEPFLYYTDEENDWEADLATDGERCVDLGEENEGPPTPDSEFRITVKGPRGQYTGAEVDRDSKAELLTDAGSRADLEVEGSGGRFVPDSEFRIAVKEIDGRSEICGDCFDLILHLQERVPRHSMSWKSVPQLLFMSAYRHCRLCELVASAPAVYLDEADPDNNFPLKPLREYEELFTEELIELSTEHLTPGSEPIEAFGHVNGVERICEASFSFEFQMRPAQAVLAIWLEPMPETKSDPLRRFENPQPERCEGVRTGSSITWREPLRKNLSWRTFELLESWMSTCLLDHAKCADSLTGHTIDSLWGEDGLGRTELPLRVLDVLGGGDVIKLVETSALDRKRAPYLTLSHCWGPPEKRPFSTTRSNLQNHIETGIQVSSLPTTFRDAIHITRQLDIRYLWIDSLCIVQDDEADWIAESEKMGTIYHHAALTIAASDAQDSTEGCFVADRSDTAYQNATTAKFAMQRGKHGNFFKTCFSHVPVSPSSEPYLSPLGHRAWACQEWYLSRRVIFCTKAGFAWKCREAEHNERGRYIAMNEDVEWEHLMERYSETHLTRETDRLIALRGIANLLGGLRDREGQVYNFGHWIGGDDTAIMLCWMAKQHVSELDGKGPPGVPSWSWASIAGAKLFWRTQYQFFHPSRNLVGRDDITVSQSDGTALRIRGGCLRRIHPRPLENTELDCHPSLTDRQVWAPEALLISLRRERAHAPIHFILGNDVPDSTDFQKQAIGLAAFDRVLGSDDSGREIYAMPVVESPRFALDPFLPEDADMIWYGKDVGASRKMFFMDVQNPDQDGCVRAYSARGLKGRPKTRYTVSTQAGNGVTKPVGFYTPPSPDEAKMGSSPDAEYVYDGEGKSIFWAMLVEPASGATGINGASDSFRRVGMALIGNEKWIGKAKPQDIVLV
ncbi:heterokaryon incompatibility protein-domain-containing protein [Immersiella caudata]|uniref:Heterokaryon incompatibility protein-domain-containing protein n=1 Tax=Immersiella caudata TaxID=314043 RepID=A0AA40C382_9PEZI|nr:heterokaryon incompatibility protein-domain-containing protein [Immersiella caudata]